MKNPNNTINKNYYVLFLDDEYGKEATKTDERISNLIKAMNRQGFIVNPINKPEYRKKEIDESNATRGHKYDAIIFDIEIWEDAEDGVKDLTCLGFNYLQWFESEGYDLVYIILSNITRSLHGKFLSDPAMRKKIVLPYLKDDVLCSDRKIQDFIKEIKTSIDEKREAQKGNKRKGGFDKNTISLQYFRDYIAYLKNLSNYGSAGIEIRLGADMETCDCYESVKQLVKRYTDKLQSNINLEKGTFTYDNYPKQEGNCFASFIKDKIGSVGEKRELLTTNTLTLTQGFIRTLIARRLLIYILLKSKHGFELSSILAGKVQYPQTSLCFPSNISKEIIEEQKENADLFSDEEIAYIKGFTSESSE